MIETSQKRESKKPSMEAMQMMPSGVTADYFNEFGWIPSEIAVNKMKGLPEAQGLKGVKLKKYIERYDPSIYRNVITDKNKELINELDGIINRLNILLEDPENNIDEIINLAEKADVKVRGQLLK